MFCSECGTKNNENDKFCQECGHKLTEEKTEQDNFSEKKPMSKKKKIIIAISLILVMTLAVGYKIGSNITSPKNIAKNYIQAIIDLDSNKLYSYLEIDGDKTFVSKDEFTKLMNERMDNSDIDIVNFKVTDVEYGKDKLNAKVNFTYTTKDSSEEHSDTINLVKEKEKKLLFFDNWKINDNDFSSMVVKDYTIKIAKGSTLNYMGIDVTNKYLNSDESSDQFDAYTLPQVFTTKTNIKAVLPNGIELNNEVIPSEYKKEYTVTFNEDSLSDNEKEQIINSAKEYLTKIYNQAISKKAFSEIKADFQQDNIDLTALEKTYTDFLKELEDSSNTLTKIDFTDISISDIELNDDGYLEVELDAEYDYTVSYKNVWSEEMETHDDSDYSYITLILAMNEDSYYLVNCENLEDYFSRY